MRHEPLRRRRRLQLLRKWEQEWAEGGDVILSTVLDGVVVGSCGLHRRLGSDGLEIGYWVDEGHLRQGIATETAVMLTSAAFGVSGVSLVEIHHDQANVASAGVPKRLDYRLVDETRRVPAAPAEIGIEVTWRMQRSDWLRSHPDLAHL